MGARVWLSGSVCLVWFIGKVLGDCVLPQHPAHGHHKAHGGDCEGEDRYAACDGTPGTLAPEDWLLVVECDAGYQLLDSDTIDVPSVCSNGVWSKPKLPQCVKHNLLTKTEQVCMLPTLPANIRYRVLAVECGGENISPGSPVPEDCILNFYCAPGFQRRDSNENCIIHCKNGSWNPSVPTNLCIRSDVPDPGLTVPPSTKAPSTYFVTERQSIGCILPHVSSTRNFCSLTDSCVENCHFYNDACLVPPGWRVKNVKVVCAPGYVTKNPTNSISTCLPSTYKWYPPIPECIKQCRPLMSEMLLMTCRYGTNIVNCSERAQPDTTVSLECAPTFSEYLDLKRQGAYRRIITCTKFGEWSDNLPPCKPACGMFNKDLKEFTPTIVNGEKAMLGFFPWHAGLYYRMEQDGKIFWDQQCGGSLISDRFVLTAAHCVYPVKDDISLLRVALGKYHRSWDHYEPSEEKRNVLAIRMSSQYVASTYTFDIALLLLSERIKFGQFIMPVCRDFDATTNNYQNSNLYVVGWGKTGPADDAKSSETLLFNSVRAMPANECQRSVPTFYNTFEKICAAKNNSVSITQKGDSGGGLTAVYRDGFHYIIGIVSTKVDNVSIFTNIRWNRHIEWMENEVRQLENNYT